MSLLLSLEIPSAYLQEWSPWTDLDFALAHKVLEDSVYAAFFASRPKDRELILDNSMHELGHPLEHHQLREAAERVHADYVVAPDLIGMPEQNKLWFRQTLHELGNDFKIGAVLCGRTPEERKQMLEEFRDAAMLLLPYREPRLAWYLENQLKINIRWSRIHLLGVNELDEARCFAEYVRESSNARWSIDTAKPIKWALQGRDLRTPGSLRGASILSKDLLDLKDLPKEVEDLVAMNVLTLRSFLK